MCRPDPSFSTFESINFIRPVADFVSPENTRLYLAREATRFALTVEAPRTVAISIRMIPEPSAEGTTQAALLNGRNAR